MNPRIVSGVVRTATSLLQNGTGATKALNSSVATAQSLVNTSGNVAKLQSDEATTVKDKFINTRAKSNIGKNAQGLKILLQMQRKKSFVKS